VQRAIGVIVVILVLFWVISAPASAAATVNSILDWLASAARSIILFVREVV
jgi:uncharacterized membrane protein